MKLFVLLVIDDDVKYAIKTYNCHVPVNDPDPENCIIKDVSYAYTSLDALHDGAWIISNM
jgi:hypothetical protein